MIFFCQELEIRYFWEEFTALGIAVWLIYTLDHLKDVNRLIEPSSERRKFHAKYFKQLKVIALIVAGAGLGISFLVSELILIPGALVASISAFYLFVSKRIDWFKEFWVAITYSVGVLLVPIVRSGMDTNTFLILGALILLALINLILFSHNEKAHDEEEGFRSFSNVVGERMVKATLIVSFVFYAFMIFLIWKGTGSVEIVSFFGLSGILYLLIWKLKWFQEKERYRIAGDAVFLFPIIFIFS